MHSISEFPSLMMNNSIKICLVRLSNCYILIALLTKNQENTTCYTSCRDGPFGIVVCVCVWGGGGGVEDGRNCKEKFARLI